MTFIKDWFRHEDNKTGCRFIVVDAYNEERVLKYYDKNGFLPLYKTEEIEKQYYTMFFYLFIFLYVKLVLLFFIKP